jgi:N-dimethylarginine dimethylaminohydrolase
MLQWGRHYVMVEPTHFRVDYTINPYMDLDDQPEAGLAMHEWRTLVGTIERLGGRVDVIAQRPDSPDMVYAMNLGLGVVRPLDSTPPGPSVVMSHMRYPQRRLEVATAQPWFAEHGYSTTYVGREGVGAHFESGDAFPWQGELLVGYGPRTDELALKHLATDLGVSVRGFRITHPGMYHFDLVFCPLDERRAIVTPSALDSASAEALLDLVPEPLVLTEEEALASFAANSIVIPSDSGAPTIVMPACPDRVREQLEDWGFTVELVDVTEFHKGGGSIRCLTNPMDITIGRDLHPVVGGLVTLPPI